jgi:hypothetical protein
VIPLRIILDGEGCWPDLAEKGFTKGELEAVAALPNGTVSGAPSVTVRVTLPDGTIVLGAAIDGPS